MIGERCRAPGLGHAKALQGLRVYLPLTRAASSRLLMAGDRGQNKAPRCLTDRSQTEDGCRGAMFLE